MRDQGNALIFISHNMDIVREMADYIIVLDGGKLLMHGEVNDVLNREEVISAYLGT